MSQKTVGFCSFLVGSGQTKRRSSRFFQPLPLHSPASCRPSREEIFLVAAGGALPAVQRRVGSAPTSLEHGSGWLITRGLSKHFCDTFGNPDIPSLYGGVVFGVRTFSLYHRCGFHFPQPWHGSLFVCACPQGRQAGRPASQRHPEGFQVGCCSLAFFVPSFFQA